MHQAGVHLGRGSQGLGKGKLREVQESGQKLQERRSSPCYLLGRQNFSAFSKSAAHNMLSCIETVWWLLSGGFKIFHKMN